MRLLRPALLVLLLAVAACVPAPPPFSSVAGTLPPIPQGQARIFFYREYEPYETLSFTTAFLNGTAVGVTQPGAVIYRNIAPGQYTISVRSEGSFPFQFKTVMVAAGQVVFVRVDSIRSWSSCSRGLSDCADTFIVNIVDPRIALGEMGPLWLVPG